MSYKYNKRKKIVRSSSLYGHKRMSKGRKIAALVITFIIAAVLVFLGYCIGEPIVNYIKNPPQKDSSSEPWTPPEITSDDSQNGDSSTTSLTSHSPLNSSGGWSAYTLDGADMKDRESLTAAVNSAKIDGYTAVVVPIKERGGKVYYSTKADIAVKNPDIISSELSAEEISSLIKGSGMTAIAEISTLYDNLAPKSEKTAGYMFEGSTSSWYDNTVENGGKPWISPFSASAKNYFSQISEEISVAGFDGIIVSDVIFPEFRNSDYGYIGDTIRNEELRGTVLYETATIFSDCAPMTMYKTTASKILNGEDELLSKNDNEVPLTAVVVVIDYDKIGNKISYNGEEFILSDMNINEKTKIIMRIVSEMLDNTVIVPEVMFEDRTAGDISEAVSAFLEAGYAKYITE